MGIYLNHPDMPKEEFLILHAESLAGRPTWPPPEDKYIVVVVDNGPFRAAGIAYDKDEFDDWMSAHDDGRDTRPMYFFHIDKKVAREALCEKDLEFLAKRGA